MTSAVERKSIYTHITSSKRRTLVLMFLFVVLVSAVVEVIALAVGLGWEAGIIALVPSGLFVLIGYYASSGLILAMSDAKPIRESDNPELYKSVENLCIGSGLPMPKIYIIDDTALNAFATGRDPKHASIAVTKGLLQKLDKLELEGVIAHELSHIGNYDTRLMMVTVVLVGLVALLADLFLRYTWFGVGARGRNRGKGEGAGGAVILVIALVMAILAPIAAQLIRLAISRRREQLADASAALLTRYPEGLASALEKISRDQEPLEVANKATAPLYISNPLKGHESWLNNLFSTHPPIQKRIAALRAM
ncbi:MAG: M48 family metallopeptidase [Dehalococcoidia bacterium]|nr:M48 family metallopeptidase [Dehalococcoidia bacterium]